MKKLIFNKGLNKMKNFISSLLLLPTLCLASPDSTLVVETPQCIHKAIFEKTFNTESINALEIKTINFHDGNLQALVNKYPRLERLTINVSEVSDISCLMKLKHLKELSLSFTKIDDSALETLAQLTNLENLNLYFTKITQLSGLETLKKLKTLNINNTPVSSLNGIPENIETLFMQKTNVQDCASLEQLKNLSSLHLGNNNFNKLPNLTQSSIKILTLPYTNASNLSDLGDLPHLKHINLTHTSVHSVLPLASIHGLHLVLRQTNVTDYDRLIHAKYVDLSDVPVDHKKVIPLLKKGVTVSQ